MFTQKELALIERSTEVLKQGLLKDRSDKYSDSEYIQNLQTLVVLNDAAKNTKGI